MIAVDGECSDTDKSSASDKTAGVFSSGYRPQVALQIRVRGGAYPELPNQDENKEQLPEVSEPGC